MREFNASFVFPAPSCPIRQSKLLPEGSGATPSDELGFRAAVHEQKQSNCVDAVPKLITFRV
jgi:hypothetical protein